MIQLQNAMHMLFPSLGTSDALSTTTTPQSGLESTSQSFIELYQSLLTPQNPTDTPATVGANPLQLENAQQPEEVMLPILVLAQGEQPLSATSQASSAPTFPQFTSVPQMETAVVELPTTNRLQSTTAKEAANSVDSSDSILSTNLVSPTIAYTPSVGNTLQADSVFAHTVVQNMAFFELTKSVPTATSIVEPLVLEVVTPDVQTEQSTSLPTVEVVDTEVAVDSFSIKQDVLIQQTVTDTQVPKAKNTTESTNAVIPKLVSHELAMPNLELEQNQRAPLASNLVVEMEMLPINSSVVELGVDARGELKSVALNKEVIEEERESKLKPQTLKGSIVEVLPRVTDKEQVEVLPTVTMAPIEKGVEVVQELKKEENAELSTPTTQATQATKSTCDKDETPTHKVIVDSTVELSPNEVTLSTFEEGTHLASEFSTTLQQHVENESSEISATLLENVLELVSLDNSEVDTAKDESAPSHVVAKEKNLAPTKVDLQHSEAQVKSVAQEQVPEVKVTESFTETNTKQSLNVDSVDAKAIHSKLENSDGELSLLDTLNVDSVESDTIELNSLNTEVEAVSKNVVSIESTLPDTPIATNIVAPKREVLSTKSEEQIDTVEEESIAPITEQTTNIDVADAVQSTIAIEHEVRDTELETSHRENVVPKPSIATKASSALEVELPVLDTIANANANALLVDSVEEYVQSEIVGTTALEMPALQSDSTTALHVVQTNDSNTKATSVPAEVVSFPTTTEETISVQDVSASESKHVKVVESEEEISGEGESMDENVALEPTAQQMQNFTLSIPTVINQTTEVTSESEPDTENAKNVEDEKAIDVLRGHVRKGKSTVPLPGATERFVDAKAQDDSGVQDVEDNEVAPQDENAQLLVDVPLHEVATPTRKFNLDDVKVVAHTLEIPLNEIEFTSQDASHTQSAPFIPIELQRESTPVFSETVATEPRASEETTLKIQEENTTLATTPTMQSNSSREVESAEVMPVLDANVEQAPTQISTHIDKNVTKEIAHQDVKSFATATSKITEIVDAPTEDVIVDTTFQNVLEVAPQSNEATITNGANNAERVVQPRAITLEAVPHSTELQSTAEEQVRQQSAQQKGTVKSDRMHLETKEHFTPKETTTLRSDVVVGVSMELAEENSSDANQKQQSQQQSENQTQQATQQPTRNAGVQSSVKEDAEPIVAEKKTMRKLWQYMNNAPLQSAVDAPAIQLGAHEAIRTTTSALVQQFHRVKNEEEAPFPLNSAHMPPHELPMEEPMQVDTRTQQREVESLSNKATLNTEVVQPVVAKQQSSLEPHFQAVLGISGIPTTEVVTASPLEQTPHVYKVPFESFVPTTSTVVKNFTQNHGGTVRMVLQPEALGTVVVQVRMNDRESALKIEVESHETKNLLDATMPQLQEQLTAKGVAMDSISVSVRTVEQTPSQNNSTVSSNAVSYSTAQGGASNQQQPNQRDRQDDRNARSGFLRSFLQRDNSEQKEQPRREQRRNSKQYA